MGDDQTAMTIPMADSSTIDRLQSYLDRSRGVMTTRAIKPIQCNDGFTMSVQVGRGLYCSPNSNIGPWSEAEVGYPNIPEPMLWRYAETPGDMSTDAVYPYVPIEVVAAVIEAHGGFIDE